MWKLTKVQQGGLLLQQGVQYCQQNDQKLFSAFFSVPWPQKKNCEGRQPNPEHKTYFSIMTDIQHTLVIFSLMENTKRKHWNIHCNALTHAHSQGFESSPLQNIKKNKKQFKITFVLSFQIQD